MLGRDPKGLESMVWRKASYSDSGEACVELACASDVRAVRDSKQDNAGPLLRLTPAGLNALTTHLRSSA